MNRVKIKGTTVRKYQGKVQIALFAPNGDYFGIVLLTKEEAEKLGRKLLRKAEEL